MDTFSCNAPPPTMSPPSAWPRELVVEARRTLLAMPVALNDAVSAGDFPGMLLDSREGIYVASFLVAALVPFVRRLFVDLVAEVREKGKGGERTRKKMMRSTPRSIPCLNINLSLSFSLVLFTPPLPSTPALCQTLPARVQAPARDRHKTVQALKVERWELFWGCNFAFR